MNRSADFMEKSENILNVLCVKKCSMEEFEMQFEEDEL